MFNAAADVNCINRALKSVLVMAGSLKRSAQDMSEEMVIMRALRDMNLPKFVYDDVPLFKTRRVGARSPRKIVLDE